MAATKCEEPVLPQPELPQGDPRCTPEACGFPPWDPRRTLKAVGHSMVKGWPGSADALKLCRKGGIPDDLQGKRRGTPSKAGMRIPGPDTPPPPTQAETSVCLTCLCAAAPDFLLRQPCLVPES